MLLPRYKILRNSSGQYRFRLLAATEGEILLRSTAIYSSLAACKKGIEVCRDVTACEECYVRRYLGKHFFKLVDRAGVEVGISQMFTTTYKREMAIAAAKRDGAARAIEEDFTA